MSQKTLIIICAIFIALLIDSTRASAESGTGVPPWLVEPAAGEDVLVVRRNVVMNMMAEASNNRVTIVKFDDNVESKCPKLTSLFFSARNSLELLTPNFSLRDAISTIVYSTGNGSESSADFVVQNESCRYVLTIKRYDRDGGDEKPVPVRDLPEVAQMNPKFVDPVRPASERDDKVGFNESTVPFDNPLKSLSFTGIAFFAPTTFTVFLANVQKDLAIASESNLLTHTYKVEIGNADAVIRISINKELYLDGQWTNAFNK